MVKENKNWPSKHWNWWKSHWSKWSPYLKDNSTTPTAIHLATWICATLANMQNIWPSFKWQDWDFKYAEQAPLFLSIFKETQDKCRLGFESSQHWERSAQEFPFAYQWCRGIKRPSWVRDWDFYSWIQGKQEPSPSTATNWSVWTAYEICQFLINSADWRTVCKLVLKLG